MAGLSPLWLDPRGAFAIGVRLYRMRIETLLVDFASRILARLGDGQKHEAACTLANRTVEALTNQQKALVERAETLLNEGDALAHNNFARINNDSAQASETRSLIRKVAKQPDGPTKHHELIAESPRVAAVLYGSERVLMSLSPTLHQNLNVEAVRIHQLDAVKMMRQGQAVADLAARYEGVARSVTRSFHNAGIANGAATRVEI